MLVAVPKY